MENELSEKGFTRFISNGDMNDVNKIIKSLEDSNILIDGTTETVNHEIKKIRRRISSCFASKFSCFINAFGETFSSKSYN